MFVPTKAANMRKVRTKQVFKEYQPAQQLLLPPNLSELIPANHLVRVVDTVIESMDISELLNQYEGGGTSAYHPRMLTKALLYGYAMKIYTGRKIAKAIREDINFMWLAAMQRPDFRTINNFRSGILKETIQELFKNLLQFLIEKGHVKIEDYFCDGSTFAADANKHKMVWKKNAHRYKAITEQKCTELFKQIEDFNQAEDQQYAGRDLPETGDSLPPVTPEQISEQVEKLEQTIAHTSDKRLKRKASGLQNKLKEQENKLAKYQRQISASGTRSGYNRTDTDASAMRMKNEEILPAYNVLIGSENQYITHYSLHQNPNDGTCFKEHIKQLEQRGQSLPNKIIADSIFGTEENYELLEHKGINNLMKYPTYHSEQKRKHKKDQFHKDNFAYDSQTDTYTCPNQRVLSFKRSQTNTRNNGFISTMKVYECNDCQGCPLALQCKKTEQHRTISINPKLEAYKKQVRETLKTEEGNRLKRKRGQEVESCFGDIKHNMKFRRFHLRGKPKVNTEMGLVCLAHNLRKIYLSKTQEDKKTA